MPFWDIIDAANFEDLDNLPSKAVVGVGVKFATFSKCSHLVSWQQRIILFSFHQQRNPRLEFNGFVHVWVPFNGSHQEVSLEDYEQFVVCWESGLWSSWHLNC